MQDLVELLKGNSYPGRGIAVGRRGGRTCVYYFIMGRSANSRNRVFAQCTDGIRTEAFDPDALVDSSLIIYHPVRCMGDDLVVTNGDQTDTIVERGSFTEALMTRAFEPDAPNFTPRISALVHANGSFTLSILRRNASGRCVRAFFAYEGVDEGQGLFISTYQHDGDPLPSFAGEPLEVGLQEPDAVWHALDADNKVSLYARLGDEVRLYNKNLGD